MPDSHTREREWCEPADRGEYIHSLRISDGSIGWYRVTSRYGCRAMHASLFLEWLHAHYEDWFLWPLADLKAKIKVRPDAR